MPVSLPNMGQTMSEARSQTQSKDPNLKAAVFNAMMGND